MSLKIAPISLARPLVAAATLIALFCTVSSAWGQSYDELSKSEQKQFAKLLDKCIAHYDWDRFDNAEEACAEAAALTKHPATKYVPARIRDKQNKCKEAVELYRAIVDVEPPGAAEARWVEEYRASIDEHLVVLGDCSARFDVQCAKADAGAVVSVDGRALGTCPSVVVTTPGSHQVALSALGKESATRTESASSGRPVELTFAQLRSRAEPSGPGAVAITCQDLGDEAVVVVQGVAVGICPLSLQLPGGTQLVSAINIEGERGAILVDVDPNASGQSAIIAPFRRLSVVCGDPNITVHIEHPLLQPTIHATCGELASGAGLTLPQEALTLSLSQELHQTRELPLTVSSATDSVRIEALDRLPVPFEVRCADATDPPVFVRVGTLSGPCPLRGEVPEGTHGVEARRDGFAPWTQEVAFVSGQENSVEVPALESISFFTPGTITTMAGGVVLLTAIAIDVAGLSTLDELQAISESDFSVCGEQDPRACYDERKDTVETNILLTRIFYGIGITATAAGAGLIVWEMMSRPDTRFGETEQAALDVDIMPMVLASPGGDTLGGVGLRLTF